MILNALRLSGCGTQHPHRALGGTCVLLAAAPTTPPCFRHWRRSSLLHSGHIQRKIYFYFAILENLRIFQNCLFTSGGRGGKRHLQRLFPAETVALRGKRLLVFSEPSQAHCVRQLPGRGCFICADRQMLKSSPFGGAGTPSGVTERVIYNSCCSNPLTVSTVRAVKPAALMAAAASSKPKVSAAVSWASAVMSTLPPSLFHSPSSHAPG